MTATERNSLFAAMKKAVETGIFKEVDGTKWEAPSITKKVRREETWRKPFGRVTTHAALSVPPEKD